MLKLIGVVLFALCILVLDAFDMAAAKDAPSSYKPATEEVSIVERHYGTPEVERTFFKTREARGEVLSKDSPKTIRIIQTDGLGNEKPHEQQFVIKEGEVYFADFAGRPDYSKPAGKLKD